MYPRKITQKLVIALKNFRIVLLNGPRQAGKTTLVKRLSSKQGMSYLTLDDPEKLDFARQDPKNFLQFYAQNPLVIDEIQFAPELIPYIKTHVDNNSRKGQFLLTGSADFMKMHEITESLAGRMVRYNLYPLSQGEIKARKSNIIDQLFAKDISNIKSHAPLAKVLKNIVRGGYPEIINYKSSLRNDWFSSYIESRIQKDILELRKISLAKRQSIKQLLQLLASHDAQLLNYNTLAKKLQITNKTVLAYVELLEAMYIIKTVPSYHVNTSLRVIKSPKIHFIDTGLASFLLHVDEENLFLHKDSRYGSLIENYVYSELLKEASYSENNVEIYHFRDLRKKEVDLVLENRNGKIIGIEVKATASIKQNALKGMVELANESKNRFDKGVIFYGGDEVRPISAGGFMFYCVPMGMLG